MRTTWILISDAHRARCFERDNASQSLTELADFIYPQKTVAQVASGGDLSGAAGKGHGRTGHAGTQFEPKTDEQTKARGSFAHQLAHYLNQAVAAHECPAIVLIAGSGPLDRDETAYGIPSFAQLANAFEIGKSGVDLTDVMIASQKASVSFQALTQVRNKLVQAYQDIMQMPV